jgi:hypothetical protein
VSLGVGQSMPAWKEVSGGGSGHRGGYIILFWVHAVQPPGEAPTAWKLPPLTPTGSTSRLRTAFRGGKESECVVFADNPGRCCLC